MINFNTKSKLGNPFISRLCNEKSFFRFFRRDLEQARSEIIIESPFITTKRMKMLYPILKGGLSKQVKIYIITRDPEEHDYPYNLQSEAEIQKLEGIGIQTLICKGNHHRKLSIIDRQILWEGSLNILSQSNSREIMRRIEGKKHALEMFKFLKLEKFI